MSGRRSGRRGAALGRCTHPAVLVYLDPGGRDDRGMRRSLPLPMLLMVAAACAKPDDLSARSSRLVLDEEARDQVEVFSLKRDFAIDELIEL